MKNNELYLLQHKSDFFHHFTLKLTAIPTELMRRILIDFYSKELLYWRQQYINDKRVVLVLGGGGRRRNEV